MTAKNNAVSGIGANQEAALIVGLTMMVDCGVLADATKTTLQLKPSQDTQSRFRIRKLQKGDTVAMTICEWLDRVQNALDVQKDCQTEIITMRFNRRDLVELRNIMSELMDRLEAESDNT